MPRIVHNADSGRPYERMRAPGTTPKGSLAEWSEWTGIARDARDARDAPLRTGLYSGRYMASARRVFVFALLILAAQFGSVWAQSGRPTTRILMLYGHDPKAPGVVAFTRALHGVLRSDWSDQIEVYEEVLDLERLGDRQRWPNFASYVARKYRGFRIDAVIAEGSTALEFAVERFDEILPGVPIVYGNAFEPVVD